MTIPLNITRAAWTFSGQWLDADGFHADRLIADLKATINDMGGDAAIQCVVADVEADALGITVNSPEGIRAIPYAEIVAAIRTVTKKPITFYGWGNTNGDAANVAKFQQSFIDTLPHTGMQFRLLDWWMTGTAEDAQRITRHQGDYEFQAKISTLPIVWMFSNRVYVAGAALDHGRRWSNAEIQQHFKLANKDSKGRLHRARWFYDPSILKMAINADGKTPATLSTAAKSLLDSDWGWPNAYRIDWERDRFEYLLAKGVA